MTLPPWKSIRDWLCGRSDPPPQADLFDDELRQASHRMSTAAANMQGIASKIAQTPDAFDALVRNMQGGRRR